LAHERLFGFNAAPDPLVVVIVVHASRKVLVHALLRHGFDVVERETFIGDAGGVRPPPGKDDLVPALAELSHA